MSDPRRASAGEAVILGLFLAATVALRVFLLGAAPPNPDETFLAGGAYRVTHGQLPVLDFIEPHAPLLARAYAPLMAWIGERADYLDPLRGLHLGLILALFALVYAAGRNAMGARAAFWTLAITNAFTFFLLRTVHVRPDVPALFPLVGALWLVLGDGRDRPGAARHVLAGVLLGAAVSLHTTMAFPLVAVLLWIAGERFFWSRRPGGVQDVALVGAAAAAAIAAGLLLLYGARLGEALPLIARTIDVDRLYVAPPPPGYLRTHVFLASPLPWLVVGEALAAYHVRLLRRVPTRPLERLFLAIADLGLLMLALRAEKFEQHFFFVALFGSALAALRIGGLIEKGFRAAARRPAPVAALAAAVFAAGAAVPAAIYLRGEFVLIARETDYVREVAPPRPAGGSVPADAVRGWLLSRSNVLLPFRHASRDALIAQTKFLLDHARPGEPVFTDWLNPPFRPLPAPYHHGLMISRFYASAALREAPAMVAFVKRYDPTFTLEDRTEVAHFLRLFAARPPRVVLLQGSMARLFATSDAFRDWIAARYDLTFDEPAGAFFAVRRDAPPEAAAGDGPNP